MSCHESVTPPCERHDWEEEMLSTIETLSAQNKVLREAIEWVLSDMAYKAPEQVVDCISRWQYRLMKALAGGGE